MNEEKPDEQFWNLADSFINLANKHSDTILRGKASTALLYAAARFNSFVIASITPDCGQFKSEKEAILE